MFTTNAALNYHCKSKHNDANEPRTNDDNSENVTMISKSQSTEATTAAKRGNKRKIPKIVYVLPGKLESEPEIETKRSKVENSKIDIQSIPIYIVD